MLLILTANGLFNFMWVRVDVFKSTFVLVRVLARVNVKTQASFTGNFHLVSAIFELLIFCGCCLLQPPNDSVRIEIEMKL